MKTLHLFQFRGLNHPIVGELQKNHEQPAIYKPLAILGRQIAPNVIEPVLAPLIGNPDVIYFDWEGVTFWSEARDKDLINDYIKATTGIQLANVIPGGRA